MLLPFLPTLLPLLLLLLIAPPETNSIKFILPAYRYPPPKCIWNPVHASTLVIVTANVFAPPPTTQSAGGRGMGAGGAKKDKDGKDAKKKGGEARVDIEIIDSSPQRNVYLSKRGISGETRLAITTHVEGEVGVCLRNYAEADSPPSSSSRIIDLDVDIGADAVDYNAIANQESLSGLETEMRKLEGLVKEIVDEMGYLKKREARFTDTNASTNARVTNFAWFTIVSLAGLGAWQIMHLRAFFKRKYLID